MITEHPALRRGVLYIEDFDDPPGTSLATLQSAQGILVPSFSAEDLEAARQQAYAEGTRDGQQSAMRERAHATRLLLENLNKSLAGAQEALVIQADLVAEELAKTLLTSLCGSLPEMCRSHAEPETRGLIKRIMPGLSREAHLEIRVHPDLVEVVRNELASLRQEMPEKLTVIADTTMEPTDIRANWKGGYLVRSSQLIWQEVREQLGIFDLLSPSPTSESEKQNAG